jgi:hypothetical protein
MNQVVKDLALIVMVFVFCALLIYGAIAGSWPAELGVQPGRTSQDRLVTADEFQELFQQWAIGVGIIALVCALAWYVLGEWGPRSGMKAGGWLLTWVVLLLVVAVAVVGALFWGPPASENGWVLGGFFAVTGLLFFYLATALFSPTNTKYVVPGSKLLRRGW